MVFDTPYHSGAGVVGTPLLRNGRRNLEQDLEQTQDDSGKAGKALGKADPLNCSKKNHSTSEQLQPRHN